MKLIVGLGNPGEEYQNSRHNLGFMAIDEILVRINSKLKTLKHKGAYVKTKINNIDVILLKPLTYMNLSGESIKAVMSYYKINIEDLLVIYDDLDTPFGQVKLRLSGGSGGHNGLKSIIQHLGSDNFKRIRLGIGKPENEDTVNYVLKSFKSEEKEQLKLMLNIALEASIDFCSINFDRVMSKHNHKG